LYDRNLTSEFINLLSTLCNDVNLKSKALCFQPLLFMMLTWISEAINLSTTLCNDVNRKK
jgi:hypothetical protein